MKKYIKELFALFILSIAPSTSMAQMTLDEVETVKEQDVQFRDSVKVSSMNSFEYYSAARDRAERLALRKQRNALEIISSLQGSLTSYNDPWVATSGGDNTTAVLGSFILNHSYKKEKLTLTSKIVANFGYNRVKIDITDDEGNVSNQGVWFKNQDELAISVAPTISISPVWSYGPTLSFRTQFGNGYVSRSQQESYELKSGFMAPGYLDISGAMTYKCPYAGWPFIVSIAPLALSATYVNNEFVKENFLHGFKDHVEGNKAASAEPYGVYFRDNSKYEGGSSIQIDFDKTFKRLNNIRYTTKLFSFYGWMTQTTYQNIVNDYDEYVTELEKWNAGTSEATVKPMLGIHPTVRWENTISIPATQVLSTTIKFQLYYNRAQTEKIQTQTYLSVGLSYTYKNK